jgi:DNA-binding NtrC family response regulator
MTPSADPEPPTTGATANHVLVVDDDQDVLDSYRGIFESNDCKVSTFTNGVDALKLIMESDVNAVFCDLMMPTMAGDMFFKAVQRIKPDLCARFVFITGFEGHPRFEEFLKKERPVVLYKPVTVGKLIASLNAALQKPTSVKR